MDTDDTRENREAPEKVAPPVKAVEATPHKSASDEPQAAGRQIGRWWKDRGFTRSLEVIIAIATVVNAWVAYVQWDAMERANTEARRSADAAVAAVKESKRQFDLQRKDAIEAAKEEQERFLISVAQQQDNASIEQGLTRSSLEESKRALAITQRARLGVEHIDDIALNDLAALTGDALIKAKVTIGNSGALPATDIITEGLGMAYVPSTTMPSPPGHADSPIGGGGVLHSDGSRMLEVEIPALGPARMESIRMGRGFLYIQGVVSYLDGFGKRRRTEFCYYHEPDPGSGWLTCRFRNRAD